jgi:hypothetical protein
MPPKGFLEQPSNRLLNIITILSSACSVLIMVIWGTWFVSAIEKRISILESENTNIRRVMTEAAFAQDRAQIRADGQLARMEARLDKIYTVVSQ